MKRICKKCKEEKELEEFTKHPKCKFGYQHICKICSSTHNRKIYNNINGRCNKLLRDAKNRAKRFKVPFELDKEWLLQKLELGICEETGIKLNFDTFGSKRREHNAPSLDRVVPEIGYTKENTKLVSFIYNAAKNMYTKEILYEMCKSFVNKFEIAE